MPLSRSAYRVAVVVVLDLVLTLHMAAQEQWVKDSVEEPLPLVDRRVAPVAAVEPQKLALTAQADSARQVVTVLLRQSQGHRLLALVVVVDRVFLKPKVPAALVVGGQVPTVRHPKFSLFLERSTRAVAEAGEITPTRLLVAPVVPALSFSRFQPKQQ